MKLADQLRTPFPKIVLTLVFAILLSSIFYFVFIIALVDPWLEQNQRELCVLNFYQNENISNEPRIFFLGTSQVKEGIDCYIVEDDLHRANLSFVCYNLAVNGDSPLRRLLELDPIIKAQPDIVVIGTQFTDVYQSSNIADSRLMLLSNKITFENSSADLFDNKQLELLHLNPISNLPSKRIYIPAYIYYLTANKIFPNSIADYEYRNNFKNPYKNIEDTTIDEKLNRIAQEPPVNDSELEKYYGNSINKLALKEIIQELTRNGISVIVLIMPNDPLKSNFISNSTRNDYLSYLDAMEITYYDFEYRYPSSYFHDLTHMNEQGRTAFSHDVAQIFAREIGD